MTPGETRAGYDGYEASRAIIQDCEDALTNWIPQNAVVTSKLSTRARNLSQRRQRRIRGEGVDLTGQDQPMDGDSWVPAHEHTGGEYDEEESEHHQHDELDQHEDGVNGEKRGREEERAVAA